MTDFNDRFTSGSTQNSRGSHHGTCIALQGLVLSVNTQQGKYNRASDRRYFLKKSVILLADGSGVLSCGYVRDSMTWSKETLWVCKRLTFFLFYANGQ